MALKAIICDLDGTLIDGLPGIEFSVDRALAELNFPARELPLAPLIGPPIRQIFSQLVDADERQLLSLEAAFRTCYDSAGWQKTVLHPHAAFTLNGLSRAGVELFIATNKPAFATGRILEALGIQPLFRHVLCRDGRTPPFESKGDMLQALIRMYNLSPAECLYIGDTEEDYRAGLEAGMQIAIVRHATDNLKRESIYPDGIILKYLTELLDRIEIKEIA
jgi:phosphoglycolate phosphatase